MWASSVRGSVLRLLLAHRRNLLGGAGELGELPLQRELLLLVRLRQLHLVALLEPLNLPLQPPDLVAQLHLDLLQPVELRRRLAPPLDLKELAPAGEGERDLYHHGTAA